jgi:integrase/recombinase XerC/integrase/recombinase XerD
MDTLNGIQVHTGGEVIRASSLEDLVQEFIQAQDVRQGSREAYRKAVVRFLTWMRKSGIDVPGRQTIIDYKRTMMDEGLSANTIAVYITAVRKFFGWMESAFGMPSIAAGIRSGPRVRGFRKDALSIDQCRELLASIDKTTPSGLRDYALVTLMLTTGLRTIEVCRLDVGDLRHESGEGILQVQGKGRSEKDAVAVLPASTLKFVHEYLAARIPAGQAAPLFASISNRNAEGRLSTRALRRIVKGRLRGIGISTPRISAHSTRHTTVTLALQAGASIQEVQALARHSDINTTLGYSHNLDRLRTAPERLVSAMLFT